MGLPPAERGPAEIGDRVRRITCANPGPMTASGTQTYLVGQPGGPQAVIDPGPDEAAHRCAILGALRPGEEVAAILVTHSHRDHSPGARPLSEAAGAPVLAFGAHGAGMSETMRRLAATHDLGGGEGADAGFAPDRALGDGETVAVGPLRLIALHTPGHLSNHLCFALAGEGVLFTGDTAMGWSTTLVSPPEGDMGAFMATLALLGARAAAGEDRLYLPGHGDPVTDPARLVSEQTAHREARAAQVLEALREAARTPAELAAEIYHALDPRLLAAAERNVLATLIWQAERGAVRADGPVGPQTRFRIA